MATRRSVSHVARREETVGRRRTKAASRSPLTWLSPPCEARRGNRIRWPAKTQFPVNREKKAGGRAGTRALIPVTGNGFWVRRVYQFPHLPREASLQETSYATEGIPCGVKGLRCDLLSARVATNGGYLPLSGDPERQCRRHGHARVEGPGTGEAHPRRSLALFPLSNRGGIGKCHLHASSGLTVRTVSRPQMTLAAPIHSRVY